MPHVCRPLYVMVAFLGSSVAFLGQATPLPNSSADAGAPAAVKIGTVNLQQAIATTDEGKKAFEALQKRFAPKEAELRKLSDEVEALKKDLAMQGPKLSQEEQNNRARTIQIKERDLKRQFDDTQGEYQQAEQDIVSHLYQKMTIVLQNLAKAEGYAMILDISDPQTPVVWRDPGTEVTSRLVAAYNQASTKAAGRTIPADEQQQKLATAAGGKR